MKKKALIGMLTIALTAFIGTSGLKVAKAEDNLEGIKIGEKLSLKDVKMDDKSYVIDYKICDVTGDNIKDHVILTGTKENEKDIYADNLNLLIQDGKTKEYIKTDIKDFGGYEGSLFTGDFTHDKVSDVMISAPTGGSGGIVGYRIITIKDGKPSVIFSEKDNDGAKFKGSFVDGFKAKLVNENLNKEITLDISASKDTYLESQIYDKNGKSLEKVEPYSNPFSLLEPIDYDGDGVYELRGYQRIVGMANCDTISNVTSIWKFENSSPKMKQLEVSSFLLNYKD